MKRVFQIQQKSMERIFESPYTERDFVQFGKTKSVLNKRAQRLALLFNPPSVLSLVIIREVLLSKKHHEKHSLSAVSKELFG